MSSRPSPPNHFLPALTLLAFAPLVGSSYCLNSLGLRFLRAAGNTLGFLFSRVHFRRKILAGNLAMALGSELSAAEIDLLIEKVYRSLGKTFLEILRNFTLTRAQMQRELIVSAEDDARIRAALANGRGALFISAHMANWELVGMGTAAQGYPVSVIAKKMNNPLSQRLIESVRRRCGLEIIYAGGTLEKMKEALARGRAIGFMLDQNITGSKGIRANFFGVPAASIRGIAGLVKETGATVHPICAIRQPDGRHRFVMLDALPYLEAPELPEGSAERKFREEWLNTQQYQTALEQMIRQQPDQWLWIHRRWKASRVPLTKGREHLENLAAMERK